MRLPNTVSFENTEIAFSYKSNVALRKAYLMFSVVNRPWMSALATTLVQWALKAKLPIEPLVRNTVFEHFCGGESIEECKDTLAQLAQYQVKAILDYSAEGESTEEGFGKTADELAKIIALAAVSPNIPFSVFKATGISPSTVLEKVQQKTPLTSDEQLAYNRAVERIDRIAALGHASGVPVMVDAEETWIQDTIDAITLGMMKKYNRDKAIVFITYQLYLTDSLSRLSQLIDQAHREGFYIGVKLVRGAYMEKERERAQERGYESPIYPDKGSTDNAFNDALRICIENIDRVTLVCGSHNDFSNAYLAQLMEEKKIMSNDPRAWFAQLYGMSDHISFNLSKLGYNVVKYVPYGPIRSVMPYLIRRAEENTSVAGQSSRELSLIRKELKRRKNTGPAS